MHKNMLKKLLILMATQGTRNFNTQALLWKKKILHNAIGVGVGHSTPEKQRDIGSLFVSGESFLPGLNDYWCGALLVIRNFKLHFTL